MLIYWEWNHWTRSRLGGKSGGWGQDFIEGSCKKPGREGYACFQTTLALKKVKDQSKEEDYEVAIRGIRKSIQYETNGW